jgi:hypothetical protein
VNLSPDNILVAIGVGIGIVLFAFARIQFSAIWKNHWNDLTLILGFAPATLGLFLGWSGTVNSLASGVGGGVLLAWWVAPKIIQRIERSRARAAEWEAQQKAERKSSGPIPARDPKTGRRSLRR